jgi:hypothetical protein
LPYTSSTFASQPWYIFATTNNYVPTKSTNKIILVS